MLFTLKPLWRQKEAVRFICRLIALDWESKQETKNAKILGKGNRRISVSYPDSDHIEIIHWNIPDTLI